MRALGPAESALALLVERAKARVAFGGPLAEQGVVREQIAESPTSCCASICSTSTRTAHTDRCTSAHPVGAPPSTQKHLAVGHPLRARESGRVRHGGVLAGPHLV